MHVSAEALQTLLKKNMRYVSLRQMYPLEPLDVFARISRLQSFFCINHQRYGSFSAVFHTNKSISFLEFYG